MSKLKKALIKLSPLSIMAMPSIASAAVRWGELIPKSPFPRGVRDLGDAITRVIQILLIAAGVVALIYLIVGGYMYVTAGGNADQAAAARTTILNAIIGLIVIFASYAIITFVLRGFLTGI